MHRVAEMSHLESEAGRKRPGEPPPNLDDYERLRATFSWEDARRALAGLPCGGLNIAHEALDRWVDAGMGDHMAMRFIARDGQRRDFSYAELARLASRFARVLEKLGIERGDRVFTLAGRIPELYIALFGALKFGAVYCPLFSAFGPEPVRSRLELGAGRVLVTTLSLYKRKVLPVRDKLAQLEFVLLTDAAGVALPPGTLQLSALMDSVEDDWTIPPTDPESMALLHFTSGTTGKPKGAMHAHQAVVAHHATGHYALDLRPGDVYWCTADPGWVTGISYGAIAPLVNGVQTIVDQEEFDAGRWYRILHEEQVNVWYTAPTAIRMLMKQGEALAAEYSWDALRHIASVGEPLNPEGVVWGQRVFGIPFHDTWWQTETGAIMIANFRGTQVRPGSMGRPVPGVDAALLRVTAVDGRAEPEVEVITAADEEGELALRPGWPSMFRGYLNDEARYRKCFAGGWYLSGDIAKRDRDGWFWFVGRADDVIKSAGHLISPFEVESALMEHPAVVEAGVIGLPDPVAGEVVKAFVSIRDDVEPGEELALQLIGFARKRLGAALAPRSIAFQRDLPRTRSGKIMRRLLKARELGLAEGDTSTLESGR
jgi:acetyl-CoA synthetase